MNGFRLSAAVMAHPRRLERAAALRDRFPELNVQIAVDPDPDGPPSALRSARVAWRQAAPGATHHLVLQDDVAAPADLPDRIRALVAARPSDPVSLVAEWGAISASLVRIAALHGAGWAPVVDVYVPSYGLVLPAELARGFDEYAARSGPGDGADDTVLGAYLRDQRVTAYLPVPHVLDHDTEPAVSSIVGNSAMGARRSACPPPPDAAADLARTVATPPVVPYLCWWLGQSVCLRQDTAAPGGWRRVPSEVILRERGIDAREVNDLLAGPVNAVRGCAAALGLHLTLVTEVGRTAFLLGLLAGEAWPAGRDVDAALETPVARAALDSLAPGGLRRFVEPPQLDRLSRLLEPLVRHGTREGLRRSGAARAQAVGTESVLGGRWDRCGRVGAE